MNKKVRLVLSVAICIAFIATAFSCNAMAFFGSAEKTTYHKPKSLIEPVWSDRYNLVTLLLSDGTGGYDFDCAQDFLPFTAHTAVGPDDAIEATQDSYFLESSIVASGTASLRTESLPQVEWATADSGSLFYVMFNITKPVKFTIIGQISARASSPMGEIESRAAVRLGFDGSPKYILDHYISLESGEKMIPFAIKGTLKPGAYYMSAWATGYYNVPGKSFSHDTGAKSGYCINLDVTQIL